MASPSPENQHDEVFVERVVHLLGNGKLSSMDESADAATSFVTTKIPSGSQRGLESVPSLIFATMLIFRSGTE